MPWSTPIDPVYSDVLGPYYPGHKILLLNMDCCATGKCAAIDWFLTFLVDHLGWFDAAGVIYFWQMHGKSAADARFALHEYFWRKLVSLSLDQYAVHLQRPVNSVTGARDTACIFEAAGPSLTGCP